MKRSLAAAGAVVLIAGMTVGATAVANAAPRIPSLSQAVAQADKAIANNRAAVHGAVGDAYAAARTIVDKDGGTAHVRYSRTYRGLEVLGGDFIVHTSPEGNLRSVTNALSEPLSLNTTPKIDQAAAVAAAQKHFQGTFEALGETRLVVDAVEGDAALAYEVEVNGIAADGQTPSQLHVIVDADTGAVRSSHDEIKHAAGTGNSVYSGSVAIETTQNGASYELKDPTRGNGYTCDMNQGSSTCATMTDEDNVWGNGTPANRQSAAIDAHHGASLTFDYFKNVHGRNGIFGDGRGVPSRVHYGNNYVNAFWNGSSMTYGDGSGNTKPLTAIDVAGHEMGHGVTESIIPGGLTYSGESGGLNESASDIWGNMVEFYANNATDPGDYDIGEKIDIFGNGKPLRYMYDPKKDGQSKNCWYSGLGSIDVHYSSGVGNLAYFFLAEGSGATQYGTAPTCDGSTVTGLGRAKAEKIWFRAMDVYFTSSTKYVTAGTNDARAATLSAATDLYGSCSAEYQVVQKAWTAVSVTGEDTACGGTPNPTPTATPTTPPVVCPAVTNGADIAIPDRGLAYSPVTVANCARSASSSTKVNVTIRHTYRGDLRIDLVAPDGTSYLLKAENINDSADHITATYTVNASSETANGTWKLQVQDMFASDTGTIDTWSLTV